MVYPYNFADIFLRLQGAFLGEGFIVEKPRDRVWHTSMPPFIVNGTCAKKGEFPMATTLRDAYKVSSPSVVNGVTWGPYK